MALIREEGPDTSPTTSVTPNIAVGGVDCSVVLTAAGVFGGLFAHDAADEITITGAGFSNKVQVTSFDSTQSYINMLPVVAESHIVAEHAASYLCVVSISAESVTAGAADEFGFGVFRNNGTVDGSGGYTNVHSHRKVGGGGGDTGSISLSGIIPIEVDDTIEVWVWNEDGTDNIVIDDITISLVMIGAGSAFLPLN